MSVKRRKVVKTERLFEDEEVEFVTDLVSIYILYIHVRLTVNTRWGKV